MKKHQDGSFSLKWGLSAAVALCWVVPVLVVVTVSGILLNLNYEKHIQHEVYSGTAHAMEQVNYRLTNALEASKAASYEGVIQRFYRDYVNTGNQADLYKSMTQYLNKAYSRNENFKSVFVTFLDHPDYDYFCVVEKGMNSYGMLKRYRDGARDLLLNTARSMDTGIAFRYLDGELYMVRNMMDLNFQPYAVLVMQCNKDMLFQSLKGITSLTASQIQIDDTSIPLLEGDGARIQKGDKQLQTEYELEVGSHHLVFRGEAVRKNLWGAMPDLRSAVLTVILLVVPLVCMTVIFFYHHITHPVEQLIEASNRVQMGERGYQITDKPRAREFQKLTRHFNSMSTELRNQFEKIYLEQQALQDAKIKALQSQINPHFLGNTLEIINWEARLAENDKVGAMIEALSTMLDAAIGRDGRSLITLEEELRYVDAYLYIIKQRMGSGLIIDKDVDEELMEKSVPRLILQPLVENAVEHDISHRRESQLCIRIYEKEKHLYLEVEHDGTMTEEDQKKVKGLLSLSPENLNKRGHVGIRNLNQRIRLIYGEKAQMTITESVPGRILAQIILPSLTQNGRMGQVGN